MSPKLKILKDKLSKLFGRIWSKNQTNSISLAPEEVENAKLRPDEMIKRERIDNTPFTIVQSKEHTFIALGMYKVSGNLTYKECREVIEQRNWSLLMNVIMLIAKDEIQQDKEATIAEREQRKKQTMNHSQNKYK